MSSEQEAKTPGVSWDRFAVSQQRRLQTAISRLQAAAVCFKFSLSFELVFENLFVNYSPFLDPKSCKYVCFPINGHVHNDDRSNSKHM